MISFTRYGWWLYSLVPGYIGWKLFGYLWAYLGRTREAPVEEKVDPKEAKRLAKKEKKEERPKIV